MVGGGARSAIWGRILASVLDRALVVRAGADVGPALGAARLARLAVSGERAEDVCTRAADAHVVEPDPTLRDHYRAPLERWRALYARLRPAFADAQAELARGESR